MAFTRQEADGVGNIGTFVLGTIRLFVCDLPLVQIGRDDLLAVELDGDLVVISRDATVIPLAKRNVGVHRGAHQFV